MPISSPILCGSIAGTLGGTGVLMHNAAYRQAGLPYTYVSFQPSGAQEAAAAMRALGIRGLGVTMPYKTEVISYLDRLDRTAQEIGAVNTIVNDDGVLTGYNTDWVGAIDGLKEVTELKDKRVAMFGAGGVARAILYGLNREGAQVSLFNIDEEQGRELCGQYGARFLGKPDRYDRDGGYDIVINATSVGFNSRETLLRAEEFPAGCVVLDVVFRPLRTAFAAEAEKAGCVVVPGYRMLILQAMAQDVLYTGQRVPYEAMEDALKKKMEQEEK